MEVTIGNQLAPPLASPASTALVGSVPTSTTSPKASSASASLARSYVRRPSPTRPLLSSRSPTAATALTTTPSPSISTTRSTAALWFADVTIACLSWPTDSTMADVHRIEAAG